MSDSFASRFKAGSDIAKDLINTYTTAKKNAEIADITNQESTAAYTEDQGAALEAKSKAVDAEGKPIYAISTDEQGNYVTTLNQDATPGAAPEAYSPSTMAKQGVSYLGKNYNTPLTEQQKTGAQQVAIGGVLQRNGDLEGAMRYRQQAQQGVLADKQIEQADLQMTQAKRVGLREDKVDAYENSRQDAFNSSVFGQKNAEYAKQFQGYIDAKGKYEAGIAAGQSPQTLGLPPQQPARAAYSLADSLADQGALLANDARHGKVDAKALGDFSENMRKIESEGYLKALNLAQGGGSIADIAKAFNGAGQMKFDPENVLSDETKPGQGGAPERVIMFKDEKGNTQSINVMAELKSLGKAGDALTQFYAGEANRRGNSGEVRADKSLVIQQAQLGIQAGSAAIANKLGLANIAEKEQSTADKKANSDLRDEYVAAVDSGDTKAIELAQKKIHGFNLKGKGGADASAFAQKVDLLMRANKEWDLAKATDVAMRKAGQSPDDYYGELMKPSGGISMSVKNAEERTRAVYPDWRKAAANNGVTGKAATSDLKPGQSAAGKLSDIPKNGAEQVISTGINKGKTAVFDGTGWVFKP